MERLSPEDDYYIRLGGNGTPSQIGALQLFRRPARGRFVDVARRRFAERLPATPLPRVLRFAPFDFDLPVWLGVASCRSRRRRPSRKPISTVWPSASISSRSIPLARRSWCTSSTRSSPWLGECELLASYPTPILSNGLVFNVTMRRYRDNLDVGIIGDPKKTPDVGRFAELLETSIAELAAAAARTP